jgi:hypothetical protein
MKTTGIIKQLWLWFLRGVKYIDFPVQTAALIFVPASSFAYPERAISTIFSGYMFIWSWQLFSAVIFTLGGAPLLVARIIHIGLSVIPAFLLMCDPEFWTLEVVMIPVIVMLVYYGLTAWWTFQKPKSGGFLRHISF